MALHVCSCPITDKMLRYRECPLCAPKADSCTAAISALLDHLVGAGKQRLRDAETERLCGL
jgi:hypothetical protein